MKVGVGVGVNSRSGSSLYSDYAFAADFKNGLYKDAAGLKLAVSSLTGYTYTRSGAKAELNASSGLTSFAANVPGIVPGVGYWSRAAVTNHYLNSMTPVWAGLGTGAIGAQTAGVGAAGTASTIINNLGATNGANVAVVQAVVATDVRTISLFVRGTGTNIGKTVRATARRSGAGVYEESIGPDLVLTADWQRITATITFANPQTGYLVALYGGATNGASSVEVSQPQAVTGTQPGPVIVTAGSAATVGADVLSLTSPITSDEDFYVLAVVNFQEGSTSGHVFTLNDGSTNNRILLYRLSNQNIDVLVTAGGVSSTVNKPATSTIASGRVVFVIRRLSGRWNIGYKIPAGTVSFSTGLNAGTFPTLTQAMIGHTLNGTQPNSPVELVTIRRGTFSDAEITAILTAA